MKVKDLREALEGVDDDVIVVVSIDIETMRHRTDVNALATKAGFFEGNEHYPKKFYVNGKQ